jgi:hypothetical protein
MKQRVFQKILFLLVCSFFTTLFLQAQTYRDWVGGATGNWTDAANWSGSNVPDAATEYARFTNTSAVNVTMPATLTVGGILADSQSNAFRNLYRNAQRHCRWYNLSKNHFKLYYAGREWHIYRC